MKIKYIGLLAALVGVCPARAIACDLCGLYTSMQMQSPVSGSLRLGVAEQFTYQNKTQDSGKYVENTEHQFLKSSITQFSAQYDLSESAAVQVILPFIDRNYRRFEDGASQPGSETGIGDMSLLLHYVPFRSTSETSTTWVRLFGGIELPTGDAHRLGEEYAEGHHHGEEEGSDAHDDENGEHHEVDHDEDGHSEHVHSKHNGIDHGAPAVPVRSAVHGHDLALGSGSWDVPLGLGVTTQYKRLIATADAQYTIRTEGAYGYRYADDLLWGSSLGTYLVLEDEAQVSLRARLSGEYKRRDESAPGTLAGDTGLNSLFLGPEITAIVGGSLLGVLAVDLPVNIENSGLQTLPGYRLRAAFNYRF